MIFIIQKGRGEGWQQEFALTFRVEEPRHQKLFVSHIKCVVKVGSVIVSQEAFKFKQFGPEKYRQLVSKSISIH